MICLVFISLLNQTILENAIPISYVISFLTNLVLWKLKAKKNLSSSSSFIVKISLKIIVFCLNWWWESQWLVLFPWSQNETELLNSSISKPLISLFLCFFFSRLASPWFIMSLRSHEVSSFYQLLTLWKKVSYWSCFFLFWLVFHQ